MVWEPRYDLAEVTRISDDPDSETSKHLLMPSLKGHGDLRGRYEIEWPLETNPKFEARHLTKFQVTKF